MVVLQKWGKASNELRALNFKLKVCNKGTKSFSNSPGGNSYLLQPQGRYF